MTQLVTQEPHYNETTCFRYAVKVDYPRSTPSVQLKSVSPGHSLQSATNNDRSFARGHFSFQPLIARAPLLTDAGHSDIRRFGGGGLFERPSGIQEEYKSLCEVVARATDSLHPPPAAPISLMSLPGGRSAAFHGSGCSGSNTAFLPCFPMNYGTLTKTNILSKKPEHFFQTGESISERY